MRQATAERADLVPGAWRWVTPPWQSNVLVVAAGADALIVDPTFFPADVREIAADTARRASGQTYVLLTHGDFDHVCGTGLLPDAIVIAAPETAARITVEAEEARFEASRDWGEEWPLPRVPNTSSEAGQLACGEIAVTALAAADHGLDGLAYHFPEHGLLACGDFLSALAMPSVLGSVEAMRASCVRLLEALDSLRVDWIVPGHGPALSPDEAHDVGRKDVAYLDRLIEAARRRAPSRGELAIRLYEIEPPRAGPASFGLYGERAATARVVAAAHHPTG